VLVHGHDIARYGFGEGHPFGPDRHEAFMREARAEGLVDRSVSLAPRLATQEELEWFHTPAFIALIRERSASGQGYLDAGDTPAWKGVFEAASSVVGATLVATEALMSGSARRAFVPIAGLHHARRDAAAGFCAVNDCALAIERLKRVHGLTRIAYVDIDAHHGDGVQDAFAEDRRVLTVSIHEEKRWPHSGLVEDRAAGGARNLPVPRDFNDSELDFLMRRAVLPLARRFDPQALVLTCGVDGLAGDPLSRLSLSNVGLWRAVERLVAEYPRAAVLGGGGYNPWTVIRCWSGLWGRLCARELPATLPPAAQELLRGLDCDLIDPDEVPDAWITTLADPPNSGDVRPPVARLPELLLDEACAA